MSALIDISVCLDGRLPVWPGSEGVAVTRTAEIEAGAEANVSHLAMNVHTGTHVDAPLHFLAGAKPLEEIPLETLVGPATVADVGDAETITPGTLEALECGPAVKRLLLRTRNSALWKSGDTTFRPDYVALTRDAAKWVVNSGIELLGIDYLSVQLFDDDPETHRVLLRAETVLLEGLNLSEVSPGDYRLVCLPLRLGGAEAAPARAVLISP